MLKIFTIALCALGAYLAWAYFGQGIGPLSSADARSVKLEMEKHINIKGGSLALPIAVINETRGKMVCGWYQRPKPIGGAVAFVGMLFDSQSGFSVASTAETDAELTAIRDVCAARGLAI